MGIVVSELHKIISQAQNKELVLPNFQREFTYERKDQKSLLVSLFCGIPIGTILTLPGQPDSFNFRDVGRKSDVKASSSKEKLLFLLDGQQRMSTLWYALSDAFDGLSEKQRDRLYSDLNAKLRSRWFLRFKRDDNFDHDIWGLKSFSIPPTDLQADLLPDAMEDFVEYEAAVKNESLNWGGSLEYPNRTSELDERELKYLEKLEANWYIPIHLMTNVQAFNTAVQNIGNRRMMELVEMVNHAKEGKYSDLQPEVKVLLKELFNVSTAKAMKALALDRILVDLASRKGSWENSIQAWRKQVVDTSIGNLELGQDSLIKGHVIFDVINKSGVKLSTFDLFCATKPKLQVRSIVNSKVLDFGKDTTTQLVSDSYTNQLLNVLKVIHGHKTKTFNDDVLKSRAIFTAFGEESFKKELPKAIDALNKAYQMVHTECGVRKISEMPYDLRILPIALAFYLKKAGPHNSFVKYYYWLSLFSGRYRENQNSRCVRDLNIVKNLDSKFSNLEEFALDGVLFQQILQVLDYNDHDSLVPKDKNYEPKKNVNFGIYQWVLSKKPFDFPPNSSKKLDSASSKLQLHHILPLGSVTTLEESTAKLRDDKKHYLNSPLNCTLISGSSNTKIGAKSFADYSKELNKDVKRTHYIPDIPKIVDEAEGLSQEAWNRDWLKRRHTKIQEALKNDVEAFHSQFTSDEGND